MVVLYGSFNCPYSFLASLRADRLAARGVETVEWRAVVHEAEAPTGERVVTGKLADVLDKELAEIQGMLAPGEPYPARRPAVQPDTTAAVAGYSSVVGPEADRLRAALFEAFWVDGLNIGDRAVLDGLGCPSVSPGELMRRWQSEWEGMERRVVPMMVLPDGRVSRGLGTLSRLAEMAAAVETEPIDRR